VVSFEVSSIQVREAEHRHQRDGHAAERVADGDGRNVAVSPSATERIESGPRFGRVSCFMVAWPNGRGNVSASESTPVGVRPAAANRAFESANRVV
jgi:hypothetical protein